MLQLSLNKPAFLLFIVAIFTVTALFPCLEGASAEQSRGSQLQSLATFDETAGDHCPNCPDQGDSDSGHCDSSCSCSCHPPVIGQPVQVRLDQIVMDIVFFEPFSALPEVYLPKFTPPQNVA